MKRRAAIYLFSLTAISLVVWAAKPLSKGRYRINDSTLFQSDGECLREITIETTEDTAFRLYMKVPGGGAEISGNTSKFQRGRAVGKAWIVLSLTTYGEQSYLKTSLKTDSAVTTGVRILPDEAAGAIFFQTTNQVSSEARPLNMPVELATFNDLGITLIVGPTSETSDGTKP